MASITGTVTAGNPYNTFNYTITDMSNNVVTVTATAQTVSIATTSAFLKDGQSMLVTLLTMLASGLKPRVNNATNSFYDYR